jgi:integrase
MPTKSITHKFVENVRAPRLDKGEPPQISYFDTLERGLALVLVVSYGGSKTFRVLTYRGGKPNTRKLGTYPAMSLAQAKAMAREYWQDPAKFQAKAEVGSFKEVATNWIKRYVEGKRLRSQPEIERCLAKYIYPRWQHRPFLEIKRSDVSVLLDHIEDNHGARQADTCLAIISNLTRWYQSRNDLYFSPVVPGMRRVNSKECARDRTLNDDEIRAVWSASGDMGTFGAIVKLLLLTAQRKAKVGAMRWDDVADGVWTIRTEPREKGNPGQLTLPKMALDIIAQQPRIAGNPHIFPGRAGGSYGDWARGKTALDSKCKMPAWVIHDLRRTARSLLSRAGVSFEHAERLLGHVIPGVAGIYDRHQYDVEKASALERLAALIQSIINPPKGNVVPMKQRRRR